MQTHVHPERGHWYYDVEAHRALQVTWVDEDETLVEACFEDGHTEQYPLAAWQDLRLVPADSPQRQSDDSSNSLSDEDYRRAMNWSEKSPDDFPNG